MGVKYKNRNPKYETIWIHTLLTGVWKFKILNFQNRGFGWVGPKSEHYKSSPSFDPSILLRAGRAQDRLYN